MKINGELHYLWRAVDKEGEVLDAFVSKRRDRKAALRFLRKLMKRHGAPKAIVTDNLGSYRAAMKVIGNANIQDTKKWHNNCAENSHQPFRRRETAMQKFVSIHSSIHNYFNHQRHLERRDRFKTMRSEALAKWRQLAK